MSRAIAHLVDLRNLQVVLRNLARVMIMIRARVRVKVRFRSWFANCTGAILKLRNATCKFQLHKSRATLAVRLPIILLYMYVMHVPFNSHLWFFQSMLFPFVDKWILANFFATIWDKLEEVAKLKRFWRSFNIVNNSAQSIIIIIMRSTYALYYQRSVTDLKVLRL